MALRARCARFDSCRLVVSAMGSTFQTKPHYHCLSCDVGQAPAEFSSHLVLMCLTAAVKRAPFVHHRLSPTSPTHLNLTFCNPTSFSSHLSPIITLSLALTRPSHEVKPLDQIGEENLAVKPNLVAIGLTRYGRVRRPQRCSILTRVSCTSGSLTIARSVANVCLQSSRALDMASRRSGTLPQIRRPAKSRRNRLTSISQAGCQPRRLYEQPQGQPQGH